MNVLDRLKLELNKNQYFSDSEYVTLLHEQGLKATDTYSNETMKKQLLNTVLEILEKLMNDIDYMRKLDSEFGQQGAGYENLTKQADRIKDKIIEIEDKENNTNNSVFMMYYTR